MLFSQICESFYYLETNEKEINLGSRKESWMLCQHKNSKCMQLNRNPKMQSLPINTEFSFSLHLRQEKWKTNPTPFWELCVQRALSTFLLQNAEEKATLENREVLIQLSSRSINWSKSSNSKHTAQNVLLIPVPTATTYTEKVKNEKAHWETWEYSLGILPPALALPSPAPLTAMLTLPRICSGILPAFFSTWSKEPPS